MLSLRSAPPRSAPSRSAPRQDDLDRSVHSTPTRVAVAAPHGHAETRLWTRFAALVAGVAQSGGRSRDKFWPLVSLRTQAVQVRRIPRRSADVVCWVTGAGEGSRTCARGRAAALPGPRSRARDRRVARAARACASVHSRRRIATQASRRFLESASTPTGGRRTPSSSPSPVEGRASPWRTWTPATRDRGGGPGSRNHRYLGPGARAIAMAKR